jgi:hypothetical protein
MMGEKEQDISESELGIIEGEFVKISQSSVRSIEGGHIEMEQVCALSVDGEKIEAAQAAVLMISGNDITMNQSAGLIVAGNNTELRYSSVPVSLTRGNATVIKSAAGIIAGGTVKADNSAAVLVLAKNIDGNMNTLFDWKSAAAFGAVLGGIWGIFTLLRRR